MTPQLRAYATVLALLIAALLLSACASVTRPDGTRLTAWLNASVTVCGPAEVPQAGRPAFAEPVPQPSPVVPVLHPNCTVLQGPVEATQGFVSILMTLAAFGAGLAA